MWKWYQDITIGCYGCTHNLLEWRLHHIKHHLVLPGTQHSCFCLLSCHVMLHHIALHCIAFCCIALLCIASQCLSICISVASALLFCGAVSFCVVAWHSLLCDCVVPSALVLLCFFCALFCLEMLTLLITTLFLCYQLQKALWCKSANV